MRPEAVEASPLLPPPSSPLPRQVGGVGLVETASEDVAVGAPVPGLVNRVMVRPGDLVRQGQPLFQLDDRDLRAEQALRQAGLELARARLERLRQAPRPREIPLAEARAAEARAQLADAETQWRTISAVTDKRAIRLEELERRRHAVEIAAARMREAEAALELLRAGTWERDLEVASAEIELARRQVERIQADLDRFTVRAPIAGRILRVNLRPGEYAALAPVSQPLILMGAADPLHVRADVDEKDAWRLRPGAGGWAVVRGNADRRFPLRFVRLEPYVLRSGT